MILFEDGLDMYTTIGDLTLRKWTTRGTATRWDNNNGRYGGGGLKGDGNTGGLGAEITLPAGQGVSESLFMSSASMFTSVLDGASDRVIQGATDAFDGNTQHGHIRVCLHPTVSGAVQVRRETAAIASSAGGVLVANQWHRIETEVRLHATTGIVKVRVDGVEVINFSGNTISGSRASPTIGSVFYGQYGGTEGNSRLDDVLIWNGAGAYPTASLDDFIINPIFPSANGDTITGTPNTGTAFGAVDDTGISDNDATYIENNGVGNVDIFQFTDLVVNGAIYGIGVNIYARAGAPGLRKARTAVKTGGTTYDGGADLDVPSQAQYVGRFQHYGISPNTGIAWTLANINALQAGYKVMS